MAKDVSTYFAGLDWASKTHAVCVIDQTGAIRARFEIPNSGKSFTGLIRRLTKLAVDGVAIERCDGPLVEALIDAGLQVVVITPRQVNGLRSRSTGSGAKSDAGDAYLLADVLRTDGHRLTPLAQDSDATRVLRALAHPQATRRSPRRDGQPAARPTRAGLSRRDRTVRPPRLRRRHRRPEPLPQRARRPEAHRGPPRRVLAPDRLQRTQTRHRALHPPPGRSRRRTQPHRSRRTRHLRPGAAARHPHREERELEADIIEHLDAHADAHIFTSLPRAGHGVRAAALLSEIGDVRSRFPDEESLAALAGVAPVTCASGKIRTVGFRWAADKKLRNALIDFADGSRHASP